jgi:hypothetical protein
MPVKKFGNRVNSAPVIVSASDKTNIRSTRIHVNTLVISLLSPISLVYLVGKLGMVRVGMIGKCPTWSHVVEWGYRDESYG